VTPNGPIAEHRATGRPRMKPIGAAEAFVWRHVPLVRANQCEGGAAQGSRGLTFDMSGGGKRAQPAGNRPLDGGVSRHSVRCSQ
jgi:hypothetical protein